MNNCGRRDNGALTNVQWLHAPGNGLGLVAWRISVGSTGGPSKQVMSDLRLVKSMSGFLVFFGRRDPEPGGLHNVPLVLITALWEVVVIHLRIDNQSNQFRGLVYFRLGGQEHKRIRMAASWQRWNISAQDTAKRLVTRSALNFLLANA